MVVILEFKHNVSQNRIYKNKYMEIKDTIFYNYLEIK